MVEFEGLDPEHVDLIDKTVKMQLVKLRLYEILKAKGLPIPPDLKKEVEDGDDFDGTTAVI